MIVVGGMGTPGLRCGLYSLVMGGVGLTVVMAAHPHVSMREGGLPVPALSLLAGTWGTKKSSVS